MGSFHLAGRRWPLQRGQLQAYWQQARRSDFLRKILLTLGTRLLLLSVGLLTGVLVTRSLGPEGRGFYAAALAIGAIGVQFGNLGLHASNTYLVAKDQSLLPSLLGNSLLVSFGLGSLGTALAWGLFTLWPTLAPVHGTLLLLALCWIPFGLATLLLQNLLLGLQAIGAYNLIELTTKLVTFGLLGLVIWGGYVTPTMLLIVNGAVMVAGILWSGQRLLRASGLQIRLSSSLFRQGISYGFKAYLAAFFSYLVLRIDLLMVKQSLGAEATGYYAVSVGMADLILMAPSVVATILFPKLSAMTDAAAKRQFAQRSALLAGGIALLLVVGMALIISPVMTLLYGAEFLPAAPAFLWLTPAIVFMAVNTIYMNYFASVGMPPITVYSPGLAALLNVGLNWWLIPRMGINGASLSSVVAYGLMLLFSLTYLYHDGSNRGRNRTREHDKGQIHG